MKKIFILIILLIATTSYAGTYMFTERPSRIKAWLSDKGYDGSAHDALSGYFQSLSNLSNGTLYDHVNDVISQHGYSGNLNNKLNIFFEAKTGNGNRKDAERSFWADTSQTFSVASPGATLVDESDRLLVEESDRLIVN